MQGSGWKLRLRFLARDSVPQGQQLRATPAPSQQLSAESHQRFIYLGCSSSELQNEPLSREAKKSAQSCNCRLNETAIEADLIWLGQPGLQ